MSLTTTAAELLGRPVIVVEIRNDDPIDLLDFTASLVGLAREHENTMRRTRQIADTSETRLLLLDVRRGSIILELAATLAPFISYAENVNTASDFVKNIASAMNLLKLPGGRLPDATTQRLKNFGDTARMMANDSKGEFNLSARYKDGEVLQEFYMDRRDAQLVVENSTAQRREIEHQAGGRHDKVLMRLHQSSADDVRLDSRSAERGIIERIDPRPRPLIYVSELAGQRIKSAILDPDSGVYQKGFVVDVDVENVNGKPRAYRILAVYDVIDLEDEQ